MANEWFFSWGEHTFGPFSPEELKKLALSGRLQPTDQVWREGMNVSVVATRVKHLFQVIAAAPAPVVAAEVLAAPVVESALVAAVFAAETLVQVAIAIDAPAETVPLPEDMPVAKAAPESEIASSHEPAEPAPATEPVAEKPRPKPPERPHPKGSARALKGAVIVAQDGKTVQFRKKCTKCGHEDTARQTSPIHNGMIRSAFYCPKCRKSHPVELQGMIK